MIRRLRELPIIRRRLSPGRHRPERVTAPEPEQRIPGEATQPLYRDDPTRAPRVRPTGLVRALIDHDPEEGR